MHRAEIKPKYNCLSKTTKMQTSEIDVTRKYLESTCFHKVRILKIMKNL